MAPEAKMDPVTKAKTNGCAVLGLGVSGTAAAEYLLSRGVTSLFLCDKNPEKARDPAVTELVKQGAIPHFGDAWLCGLPAGLIVRSPGIRPDLPSLQTARAAGATVTGEVGLFLEKSPARIFAVTGSSGKSTVTSLVSAIFQAAGRDVFAGGNLGASLLPALPRMTKESVAVLELSSFQLMDLSPEPERAAILNLTENHLNWHTGMAEYRAAKERILGQNTVGVLPAFDPALRTLAKGRRGSRLFSPEPPLSGEREPDEVWYVPEGGIVSAYSDAGVRRLFPVERLHLPGTHNLLNLLAAVALTDGTVPTEAIETAVESFRGIPHRMETVPGPCGVRCIDSSIDTTPERTRATLEALAPVSPILLLGGAGKGLSYKPLCEPAGRAKGVILFGRDAPLIAAALDEERIAYRLIPAFDDAVNAALATAEPGDTVLLSPACTGYDAFRNFAERGDRFRALCRAAR